tara:strand:- start:2935 stop:3111 length:177 start_codon:yes stop_codon:yes gene_type:complete
MSEETKLTKSEFQILAQLIDGGIRAAGINIATGGNDLISAIQKFYKLQPEDVEVVNPD